MKDISYIHRQETQPLPKPKDISKDIEKFLANQGKIQNIPQGKTGIPWVGFNKSEAQQKRSNK